MKLIVSSELFRGLRLLTVWLLLSNFRPRCQKWVGCGGNVVCGAVGVWSVWGWPLWRGAGLLQLWTGREAAENDIKTCHFPVAAPDSSLWFGRAASKQLLQALHRSRTGSPSLYSLRPLNLWTQHKSLSQINTTWKLFKLSPIKLHSPLSLKPPTWPCLSSEAQRLTGSQK